MQILYQIIQWKPDSWILIMITNFDKKCKVHGSKGLHLPKSHFQLATDSMGVNGAQ